MFSLIGVWILFQNENAQMKRNATTIETLNEISRMRKDRIPPVNPYNLGRKENFREVFGDNPLLWFLPIFTSRGNGLSFPVRGGQRPREEPDEEQEETDQLFAEDSHFEQGELKMTV